MPTVHLVRHGAHGLLDHTLAGRMPGVGLSAEGWAQARALGERFRGEGVAAVLSSPVQRAMETAGAIAAAVGLGVTVEPGFEEIDFGRWTGMRFSELDGDAEWARWNALRSVARCPGGETMHGAQSRALDALGRSGAGCTVVVSHSDVIKAVLAGVLGMSLDHLQRLVVGVGSVSTVGMDGGAVWVERVNREP